MDLTVQSDFTKMYGVVEIPSDKSVSHRAVILSSLARGKSVIKNFSQGVDPLSSIQVCQSLGVEITKENDTVYINSKGILHEPRNSLYCGNSGTTMRLMSGVLAACSFSSILTGDESLSKRPMKRIINPLEQMGAEIKSMNFHAPLEIKGQNLSGINYISEISSAQVKSCVLLAGLYAEGKTTFTEPNLSRNHTEIMLKSMGADIYTQGTSVTIGKSRLEPLNTEIFGDISSAAYFIVTGLIVPKSKIILQNIGLNPTRTGIIDVVKTMGGNIDIINQKEICGEIVGDVKIEYSSDLKGCEICGEIIPKLIDEIPVIALLATQAQGETVIKDAQDLRSKESDRIKTTVSELAKLGADITETSDGMIIKGKKVLTGGVEVCSYKDHRLAMMLYAAGLICKKGIRIKEFDWVNISFPNFLELMEGLRV